MDKRLFYPATNKNSKPISEVLFKYLPNRGVVLEIASGSGQHAIAFQALQSELIWQTSDPATDCRKSIRAWIEFTGLITRMPQPLNIDVNRRPWPLTTEISISVASLVCINMIHVTSWDSVESLFSGSKDQLPNLNLIYLYGPFKRKGKHISISNELFDTTLKNQNKEWGIRNLEDIDKVAYKYGFNKSLKIPMPSYNFSAIFRK